MKKKNKRHCFDDGGELYSGIGSAVEQELGTFNATMQRLNSMNTTHAEDTGNTGPGVFNGSSYDSVLADYAKTGYLKDLTFNEVRGYDDMQEAANIGQSIAGGASAGASFGPIGAAIGAAIGLVAGGASAHFKNQRANTMQERRNNARRFANSFNQNLFNNSMDVLNSEGMHNLQAAYAKCGGSLGHRYAEGGMFNTHGGMFSNGLSFINEGGKHGENPMGGVPMGIAADGQPNLVEEGEVKTFIPGLGDYIFSNNKDKDMLVPDDVRKKYKLKKNATFADAVKKLQKESEERPNDPISKNGLDSFLNELAMTQEAVRMRKQEKEMRKAAPKAEAGHKFEDAGILYDGPLYGVKPMPTPKLDVVQPTTPGSLTEEQQREANRLYQPFIPSQDNGSNGPLQGKTYPAFLKYAPLAGGAITLANNLFTKPDYSNADRIMDAARDSKAPRIGFNVLGDYLRYTPLDRNYYGNKLAALAGANRRVMLDLAGGNRGTAMASLLASDNNYLNSIGQLARQAEEYNADQRQKTAMFNRETNRINSEGMLRADEANQRASLVENNKYLQAVMAASQMRQGIKDSREKSIETNLTNLFDNIGALGNEYYAMNSYNWDPRNYYTLDSLGRYHRKNVMIPIRDERGFITGHRYATADEIDSMAREEARRNKKGKKNEGEDR